MSRVPHRPTLLVIAFSPLQRDARVLKQIALFRDRYDIVTCGMGEAPYGVAEHVRIPDGVSASRPYGRWLTLKQYRLAYWRQDGVRWVRHALRGRRFDVVIANDVEAIPLALRCAPREHVHADLHEYSPRMREERPRWRERVGRYLDWICRHYVSRAASWTTVSSGIAAEYEREFGFRPELVTNATPYADLAPRSTAEGGPIRLVHSGASLPNRGIEELAEAVSLTRADVTLDLFLMSGDVGLEGRLRERAEQDPRIRLHPGVPYRELVPLLNGFDAGVHLLPPTNFNHRHALPNKLFDFVQARIAVITGPTAPMADLVREHGLGWVTDDFSAAALARVLDGLDTASVEAAKRSSHAAARALSAERQMAAWESAIASIASRAAGAR